MVEIRVAVGRELGELAVHRSHVARRRGLCGALFGRRLEPRGPPLAVVLRVLPVRHVRRVLLSRSDCPCAPPGRAASSALRLLGLDLDALGLLLLGLRYRDREDAVLVAGLDLLRLHALREGQAALEAAEAPLDAVVPLVVDLLLELALALDGEHVVVDLDLDVVGVHARELGLEDDRVGGVEDVDRRQPALLPPAPDLVHQPVELVLDLGHLAERVPSDDRHGWHLPACSGPYLLSSSSMTSKSPSSTFSSVVDPPSPPLAACCCWACW